VHAAAQLIAASFDVVFDYMADPLKVGRWSLGCFAIAEDPDTGLYAGTSLYDGKRGWIRVSPDRPSGLIDYHVGTPDHLAPRIFCRVAKGEWLGYGSETSLLALIAWRGAGMSEVRWRRLQAAHEAEIWLIKEQIESQ
jgi:hypothetical protein